jgi:hypothetical protein
MGKKANTDAKPDLPARLFWDFRYDDIDWKAEYLTVITRVIERGNAAQWIEMIRFYGEPAVIHALQHDIAFLADYAIEEVCKYFPLRKEELLCYTRKQSKPQHWI